jgi:uncharacterized protein (TIGR02594 family)
MIQVSLPGAYSWIDNEPGPKLLLEMRNLFGVKEAPGKADNPVILEWAKEVGVSSAFKHDETAWCGLSMAVAVKRAGYKPVNSPLWALNWAYFGSAVANDDIRLGDILTFKRFDAHGKLIGGHVTLYVGEDAAGYFHCLGGNQSDSISFARINKNRLNEARRCEWSIGQPFNVRKILLSATGTVTTNEA